MGNLWAELSALSSAGGKAFLMDVFEVEWLVCLLVVDLVDGKAFSRVGGSVGKKVSVGAVAMVDLTVVY